MSIPPNDAPVAGLSVREEGRIAPADTEVTRRTALRLLSATALLASGALGCARKPERKIVSLHDAPEYQTPGVPLWYASTWTDGHWPYGIMVKVVDGRPVKVEGLPDHPLNRGTSTAWMQASLLSLYDPERLRQPMRGDQPVSWEEADRQVVEALREAQRVLLVTRASLSPSERTLIERLKVARPGLTHVVHETVDDRPRRRAWREVYGRDGILRPNLAEAQVVLAIDADFLGLDGDVLGASRDYAARRGAKAAESPLGMLRLWSAESALSVTGAAADHRIPLRPAWAAELVRALTAAVGGDEAPLGELAAKAGLESSLLLALAADLKAAGSRALVLAGPHLPEAVHAEVALLNGDLGANGKTLVFDPAPPVLPADDPAALLAALDAAPDVALFLGVNPVYDLPADDLPGRLAKVKLTVGHGLTRSETLAATTLALPSAHGLESWNDARPVAGVTGLCQPQIRPLFDGRQEAESLLAWARALSPQDPLWKDTPDWHAFVAARFGDAPGARGVTWEEALRRGFVGTPSLEQPQLDRARAKELARTAAPTNEGLDLVLAPHHGVFDGRYAGNAWLQELPEPASKLVWDSAATVGPSTARRLGLVEGDWVTVRAGGRAARLPILVQPGVAPDTVVATLGHGRTIGAGVADGCGASATALLTSGTTPRLAHGVVVEKVAGAKAYRLVRTQTEFAQHDRPIVLDGTLAEWRANPAFVEERRHIPPLDQLHEAYDYTQTHKWVMAIDLSACTGCNACMVACQAENNIQVVGKSECDRNRDMHWIRIDRYYAGDMENPKVSQQPMLCQHCDNAPCENVCPVNATAHSPEGLNEQAYNRCVGTRYCGNNCPYKVRRFNYFNYTKERIQDPVQELVYNPQVTVRSRGVMEKCTFCVQRITAAKFEASNAGTTVADGQVRTACQQACPTQAIFFGDANDKAARVTAERASPLAYHVLEEMNVRPNVAYLARIRNPSEHVFEAPTPGGHG